MGAKEQRPSAVRLVVVTALGFALIFLGTTMVTVAGAAGGSDEAPPVSGATVEPGTGPVGITSPEMTVQPEAAGEDITSAWASPWAGAGPRDEPNAIFDNGQPLDDWGDPASQLSPDPNNPAWKFVAAAADDFVLPTGTSPTADFHITKIRAPFIFFNGNSNQTPANWLGIDVTVYANSATDLPSGYPLIDGSHSGLVIATQWVPQGPGLVLDPVIYLTCRKVRKVDITVDFRLPKGTRFWLSLVPRYNAPPQTAWCLSATQTSGLSAVRGASFGPAFWNTIEGNSAICSGSPAYHTRKNLSFQLYGEEMSTSTGACCNISTGVCRDGATEADCVAQFEVYHGGSLCEFVNCRPVTGACCNDAVPSCQENVNIASCQGPTQRFSAGQMCAHLVPLCGVTGACCLPNHTCQDLTMGVCSSLSGTWHEGSCTGPDPYYCPLANDQCADAALVLDGSTPFSTLGATTDGPLITPHPGCAEVNQDVWFQYHASCSGILEINLCDATYNSAMTVYEGCTCPPAAGPQVACNDDACVTGNGSKVILPATSGNCYLIRIGGVGTEMGAGTMVITCTPSALPTGACCRLAGGCDVVAEPQCMQSGDVFYEGESCSAVSCPPPPIHDCCLGDIDGNGEVEEQDIPLFVDWLLHPANRPARGTIEFCRADINGDLNLDGLDMQPFVLKLMAGGPCHACCHIDGTCDVTLQAECVGTWTSAAACDPDPCCHLMGDMNDDGTVNGLDIQGFVDCLLGGGTNCVCGDFNSDSMVDLGDLPAFLSALGVPTGP